MARDLFVYWTVQKPKRELFEEFLKNYLEGLGTVEFVDTRWICSLPGQPTHYLQCLAPDEYVNTLNNERWFEVCWGKNCVDIITRRQDAITQAIAEGFANRCVVIWQARKDDV